MTLTGVYDTYKKTLHEPQMVSSFYQITSRFTSAYGLNFRTSEIFEVMEYCIYQKTKKTK